MAAESARKKTSSANPTVFVMDHPITILMMVLALVSLGFLAFERMQVDIFPSLNTPKIYVLFVELRTDPRDGFEVS